MSSGSEDNSFFVYASVRKGAAVISPNYTTVEATIYKLSSGFTKIITLRDNGLCKFCVSFILQATVEQLNF